MADRPSGEAGVARPATRPRRRARGPAGAPAGDEGVRLRHRSLLRELASHNRRLPRRHRRARRGPWASSRCCRSRGPSVGTPSCCGAPHARRARRSRRCCATSTPRSCCRAPRPRTRRTRRCRTGCAGAAAGPSTSTGSRTEAPTRSQASRCRCHTPSTRPTSGRCSKPTTPPRGAAQRRFVDPLLRLRRGRRAALARRQHGAGWPGRRRLHALELLRRHDRVRRRPGLCARRQARDALSRGGDAGHPMLL